MTRPGTAARTALSVLPGTTTRIAGPPARSANGPAAPHGTRTRAAFRTGNAAMAALPAAQPNMSAAASAAPGAEVTGSRAAAGIATGSAVHQAAAAPGHRLAIATAPEPAA